MGVLVDDELEFETHIAEITQNANKILGIIKRNFRNIGRNTFLLLYKSMVRSKLEYAQNVWSPYKMKYIERIHCVQKKTHQNVFDHSFTKSGPIYIKFGMYTVRHKNTPKCFSPYLLQQSADFDKIWHAVS